MYRVLDIFSGIGGFSLGLERTGGFETQAFCEIDPFCRKVLAKHWPDVPCYEDVRDLTAARLAADGIAVDVICGGFPCQDVSFAGKRAGLEGARSGLWGEYRRLIGEVRPRFVIVENVPGLLSLGMGTVLGDLSALGFDAVWDCVPASAVGATHQRDRVWLVGYANDNRQPASSKHDETSRLPRLVANPTPMQRPALIGGEPDGDHAGVGDLADAARDGRHARRSGDAAQEPRRREPHRGSIGTHMADPDFQGLEVGVGLTSNDGAQCEAPIGDGWWSVEPDVGRVAHGVPARVDRLRGLGNAVVPQIPEMIGRAILQAA